eukprot:gene5716-6416_t
MGTIRQDHSPFCDQIFRNDIPASVPHTSYKIRSHISPDHINRLDALDQQQVNGLPITDSSGSPTMTTGQILDFLVRYGYLSETGTPSSHIQIPPTTGSPIQINATHNSTATDSSHTTTVAQNPETVDKVVYSRGDILRAIGDFQEFMSLKKTRKADSETVSMMVKPRCGVKDKSPHVSWIPDILHRRRKRRYATEDLKWPKTAITYSLTQSSNKISVDDQKKVLKSAFNRWAEVCPLVFTYTDNSQGADINIRFASGSHGDALPFDGPNNVLAHAFPPASGGDVHFDEDENWVTGLSTVPYGSKSLLQIAIHEIGHSLGLKHSSISSSIMHPSVSSGTSVELHADDVSGVQSLYGKCSTSITSVISWIYNGKTYFFKGANSWRFDDQKSESEKRYPKIVSDEWPGVPNDVDEAFLWWRNWVTYFFKGNQYYRYNDALDIVEPGYPKLISTGWPGIPDNIDAAFSYNTTVSYFFKGNLCYKFDSINDKVFTGYPKTISQCFPGVPDNLDSAVRYYWDNVVYFFKGVQYYKLDSFTNTIVGPLQNDQKWKNLCLV